jgi:drug/metabolite transporter (DMT)-like permease
MNDPVPKPPIPPVPTIVFGILAVSTSSIFVRYAQAEAPSLVISAWRLLLATIVLAPFVLAHNQGDFRTLSRGERLLAFLSGLFLAVHFATWITSLEYTTVSSSVVLVSTSPLWVAILSPLLLKEPLTRPIILGMVLALLGSIIVGVSDACAWTNATLTCPSLLEMVREGAFFGNFLALTGAWMGAGYLLIGRRLRMKLSLLSYIFLIYGVAALVLVLIMVGAGYSPWGYSSQIYVWLVLLALIPQLLGHSTFNWALRYLPAAFVAITLLGEPIGSTILAYFLLEERPTGVNIFGAILILVGIFIASQREPGESRNKNERLEISNDQVVK